MSELKKEDFDSIFSFHSVINSDYSNYESIVLFSLATIFKIQLAAFGVFRIESDGSKKVDHLFSNHIRKEILNQYKREYYLWDPFFQNYSQLCYSHPYTTFFTDDMLEEYGGLQNSKYGNFIQNYNIAHAAMIGVNGTSGSLVQTITVYKTEDAGAFSEREKELFQYIGKAFNNSKTLYNRFMRQQRRLDAVSAYFDELLLGFAVLDEKGHLLHHNSAFMLLSANLSSGLTKNEIANDIIFAVTGTGKLPEENYYKQEAHVNGLILTMQKKRAVLSIKTENLYFITLQKDKVDRVPEIDSVMLSSNYGLTRREAEVALLIAKGFNNQEISDELFIGISTVKSHISGIYSKLMVSSRTEMLKKLRKDEIQNKS